MAALLTAKALRAGYGAGDVLQGIDIAIATGEIAPAEASISAASALATLRGDEMVPVISVPLDLEMIHRGSACDVHDRPLRFGFGGKPVNRHGTASEARHVGAG